MASATTASDPVTFEDQYQYPIERISMEVNVATLRSGVVNIAFATKGVITLKDAYPDLPVDVGSDLVSASPIYLNTSRLYALPVQEEESTENVLLSACTKIMSFLVTGTEGDYTMHACDIAGNIYETERLFLLNLETAQRASGMILELNEVATAVYQEDGSKTTTSAFTDLGVQSLQASGIVGEAFPLTRLTRGSRYMVRQEVNSAVTYTPCTTVAIFQNENDETIYELRPLQEDGTPFPNGTLCAVVDTRYAFSFAATRLPQEYSEDTGSLWLWAGDEKEFLAAEDANIACVISSEAAGYVGTTYLPSRFTNGDKDLKTMYITTKDFNPNVVFLGRPQYDQYKRGNVRNSLELNILNDTVLYFEIALDESGEPALLAKRGDGTRWEVGSLVGGAQCKLYAPTEPTLTSANAHMSHVNVRFDAYVSQVRGDVIYTSNDLKLTQAPRLYVTYTMGNPNWTSGNRMRAQTTDYGAGRVMEYVSVYNMKIQKDAEQTYLDPNVVQFRIEYTLSGTLTAEENGVVVEQIKIENQPMTYTINTREQLLAAYTRCPNQWGYDFLINLAEELTKSSTIIRPVTVEKVWRDGLDLLGARPESVTLELWRKSVAEGAVEELVETLTLSAEDVSPGNNGSVWARTLTGLPVFDSDGILYDYYVKEPEAFEPYVSTVSGNTATNTLVETGFIDLHVEKKWQVEDGQELPTHVLVDLYRNGLLYRHVNIFAIHDWKATVNNLPVTDGVDLYEYTIKELGVDGYAISVSDIITHPQTDSEDASEYEGECTVTNTQLMAISGTKTWHDQGTQIAHDNANDLLLTLWRAVGTEEPEALGNVPTWEGDTYTFSGLPIFDANGERYQYTVTETILNDRGYNYFPSANGYDFVNTRILDLPNTGGSGVAPWYAAGAALMLLAVSGWLSRRLNRASRRG